MKKIIYVLIILILTASCSKPVVNDDDKIDDKLAITEQEKIRTSFLAVGDNLIHGAIYADPHFVNNNYDFTPIYSEVKPEVMDTDIAYINQETILGGRQIGLSHYPAFNSPQEIGDAIVDAGFDWVNHATNHTLDRGEIAILNTIEYWNKHPQVAMSGIAESEEAANKQVIIERNGLKFGLLSYTYGTNGIPFPENKTYLTNLIDKDKMASDIKALKANTDIILVSLHWGIEYSFKQNEEQEDIANFLNDLEVDVIIGTHPHVIQPVEIIKNNNNHKTLVMYSLGNFLSAQDVNYRMLGGMLTWDIVYDPNDKSVNFEKVTFKPLINYFNHNIQNFKIYYLKDYTNELANSHGLSSSYDMSREYFTNLVDEVIGNNIQIEY